VPVFANCVPDAEQEELLRLVEDLKKASAKFKTAAAHGDSLQQFWLRFLQKCASVPFISSDLQQAHNEVDAASKSLPRMTDRTMSSRPRQTLIA
jgi:hypothetical protein